ncbi:MAG: single-stranded DNA-binding protein [Leptospiraceae bacterium]|nr:single-stranded DNA-binding protein [Leptospiraceae bacterium]
MDLNKVILVCRLTRDAECKTIGETNIANFSIAYSTGFRDKKKSNYIDCVAFGKTADVVSKYTKKGSQIAIEGSLEQDSWDSQDGKKNYKTKIRIASLQLLGSKDGQPANTDNTPSEDDVF